MTIKYNGPNSYFIHASTEEMQTLATACGFTAGDFEGVHDVSDLYYLEKTIERALSHVDDV